MMEYLTKDIGYAIPIRSISEIEEVTLEELKKSFQILLLHNLISCRTINWKF